MGCPLRRTLEAAQAFDGKTGLPYKAVEMRSWPKMERMSGSFRRTFTRAVIESFYATDTSEGIWVMFRRWGPPVLDHSISVLSAHETRIFSLILLAASQVATE